MIRICFSVCHYTWSVLAARVKYSLVAGQDRTVVLILWAVDNR